jgi:transposase
VTERGGAPLAVLQTAANVNEGTVLERLVDAIPALRQPRSRAGGPRRRPAKLHADKAYASRRNRAALRRRHIAPRIARPKVDSSERLGRYRWVAERSFAWLHRNRRLLIRYERRADLHQAFLDLGAALICWQLLTHDQPNLC